MSESRDPSQDMVDPTHPYGPGGARKDDAPDDVMTNPAATTDMDDLADPTHPYGEGGRIEN